MVKVLIGAVFFANQQPTAKFYNNYKRIKSNMRLEYW